MADKIKHKRSSTPAAVPTAGQLELGELAINTADGFIYLKKSDGSVVVFAPSIARTWQDMTASRAVSTTYTAPSDRSIHVIISAAAASNVYVHAKIGSLPVFGNGAPNVVSGDDVATVSFEVPPGGTYRLEAISGTLRWLELR